MNKNYVLYLNNNIEIITKEGKKYIHNKSKQELYGLNAVASILIEFIADKQTYSQIIELLAVQYAEVDLNTLESDTMEFIQELIKRDVILQK